MKTHQEETLRFIQRLAPGKLLDAGSGTDALASVLREKGYGVISLDLYSTGKKGRFVKADLNRPIPFIDAAFDYLLCSESMQYLENHAALMREFARVVRPGGSVVISTPNVLNAASRLYFLQRGYFPSFKPVRTVDAAKGWDSIVYNPVTLVDIITLGGKCGLEVKEVAASRKKTSAMLLYPFLKLLYLTGLFFDKDKEKAALIRRLSSKEALTGDHIIIRLERVTGG